MSRFDERLATVRKERAARTESVQRSPAAKTVSQARSDLKKEPLNIANTNSKFDQRLAEIRKNRKQNTSSYTTPQIITPNQRDANFWDVTVNSAKRGYYNSLYGEESFNEMMGFENEKQKYADILADDDYQFKPENGLETAVSGFAEQAGQWFRQWTNPRTLGITGAAGGAALVAGQLGPQVALPEEVITVPSAAITGFKTGTALSSFEIEAGHAYNELIEQGISPETAKNIALGVGVANAGLEFLQVDELLDALKVLKKSGATKTVSSRIAKELIDRGVDIGKETLQEVGQEAVTIGGVQLGSQLERGEWAYDADEVLGRLGETAKSSALTFGLMNTPSGAIHTSQIVTDSKTALQNTPDLQEKITNRLKELGETQKAEQVGELISRYAQGEKLTKKERHIMASSKPSLQVVVEAKNGRFTATPNRASTTFSIDNLTAEERHAYRMQVDEVIDQRNNAALEKILSTDINGMTREQLHANREFVESEIYKTSKFATRDQLRSNTERIHAEMEKMGITPTEDYNGQYAQNAASMVSEQQPNHSISMPESNAKSYDDRVSAPDYNGQYMMVGMLNPGGVSVGVSQVSGNLGGSNSGSVDIGRSGTNISGDGRTASDTRTNRKEGSNGASNDIPWENKTIGTLNSNYLDKAFEGDSNDTIRFFGRGNLKNIESKAIKKFIKENKPKGSPRVDRWLDKNCGTITIKNIEGVQVWKYEDSDGDYAYYYRDGEDSKIVFPEKYLCTDVPTVNIGSFSQYRKKDGLFAANEAKRLFGVNDILRNYSPHHTYVNGTIQFVKKSIHDKFPHYGGFSKFRNRRN